MSSSKVIKTFFLFVLLLVNIIIWNKVAVFSRTPALKVVFLNVGQGDSIFIETKSGNQVLVDGGPNDSLVREISKEMSFFDKDVDIVIATHPDADHIGGLPALLERFDVNLYVESGNKSKTLIYQSLEKTLSEKKTKRIIARKNMVIDLGGGTFISILFPDRDASGLEANTASIVLKLNHGQNSFLLTGDSPIAIENYLVSTEGRNLRSEVLKLGHHGSKTSTSGLFFSFVSPKYSVISAGEGNRYGHPHEEVLSRVKVSGSEILETAKLGAITFFSDGGQIWVK